MGFYFCSLSSGSSGNCYLIRSETTAILVDAGISGKRTIEGLASCGTDPDMVSAILITHEHSDHVSSLKILKKKLPQAYSYSNFETWEEIQDRIEDGRHVTFDSGESFTIGDIEVKSFATHHDSAGAVSYSFFHDGKQISILTDTGYVCDRIFDEIKEADLLALEANHDVNVLQMCSYPYYVKRRILGDGGHLSNEAAADCIVRIIREQEEQDGVVEQEGASEQDEPAGRPAGKMRRVLLAHLSDNNNSPEMALITVKSRLEEEGIDTGSKLELGVITRNKTSSLFSV